LKTAAQFAVCAPGVFVVNDNENENENSLTKTNVFVNYNCSYK